MTRYILEVKKDGKVVIRGAYVSKKQALADMVTIAYYGHVFVSVKAQKINPLLYVREH